MLKPETRIHWPRRVISLSALGALALAALFGVLLDRAAIGRALAETFTATNIVGTSTITTPTYVVSGGTTPTITVCNAAPPTAIQPAGSICMDTTNSRIYVSSGGGTWVAAAKSTGTGTANFVPIWASANTLGNSDIQQTGGFISTPSTEQWTISSALQHGATQHGALTVFTQGVGLTIGDGGVQSFQQSTIDVTAADSQSLALYAGNSATKSAGAHLLTNYGVLSSATGGDSNYSFYGVAGFLYNANAAHFGSTLQVDGALTAGGGLTVGTGQSCSLSTNVQPFAMPAGTGGSIIIGATSTIASSPGVIQIQNTGATRNLEIDMIGNTTTLSNVVPRFGLYRGAAGGSLVGALQIDDGTFGGVSANDEVLYAANNLAISAGGTTAEIVFTKNDHINIPSAAGKPVLTACGTTPTNTGSDIAGTFTTGTGGTTCTITFVKTYTNTPACQFATYGSSTLPTCTVSATAITCSVTVAATTYAYQCHSMAGT